MLISIQKYIAEEKWLLFVEGRIHDVREHCSFIA